MKENPSTCRIKEIFNEKEKNIHIGNKFVALMGFEPILTPELVPFCPIKLQSELLNLRI